MSHSSPKIDPLDAIALEFIESIRRGEDPAVAQFAARHPQFAARIEELFPTIRMMEKLRDIRSEHVEQMPPPMKLERLGDLRLIREIGRGGMGVVFEAEQESLERRVAVKVLPTQKSFLENTRLTRFKREARTAAKLHHTNIVPILGVGECDGYHFYLMQLIDGVGLDDVIAMLMGRDHKPGDGQLDFAAPQWPGHCDVPIATTRVLTANGSTQRWQHAIRDEVEAVNEPPPEECRQVDARIDPLMLGELRDPLVVVRLAAQAGAALQYAHEQSILHRDIKPANLILDTTGTLWIADFGLAKSLGGEEVTETGDVLGTFRYMAPEQFVGQADVRSDLYSLGLTIYELLTGRPAHDERVRRRAFVAGEVAPPPVPPTKYVPSLPRDLETVILKAIATEPAERYQSAAAFTSDLECILNDRPIHARRTRLLYRFSRWCRRNRFLAASLGMTVLTLVLLAATATRKYYETKSLNRQVTLALHAAENALKQERQQRRKAEATSAIAWDALDEIFVRFAPPRLSWGAVVANETSELSVRPALSTEVARLLEGLLEYYDRLANEGDDAAEYRRRIGMAHYRIGEIYQRLGKTQEAEPCYQRAMGLFQELAEQSETGDWAVEDSVALAVVTNELAEAKRALGDRATELAMRQEVVQRLAELLQTHGKTNESIRYELARTLYLHGRLTREPSGKPLRGGRMKRWLLWPDNVPVPKSTAEFWEAGMDGPRALNAAIQMLAGLPDCESRYLLARCYMDAAFPGGRVDWDAQAQAQAILQQLVREFPDVTDFRFELCLSYVALAARGSGLRKQDLELHSQALEHAVEHSRELVRQHPYEPAYHLLCAQAALKLAQVPTQPKDPALIRQRFEAALHVHREMAGACPDSVPCLLALVHCKVGFARLQHRLGEHSAARRVAQEALDILGKLRQEGVSERLIEKPTAEAKRQLNA